MAGVMLLPKLQQGRVESPQRPLRRVDVPPPCDGCTRKSAM